MNYKVLNDFKHVQTMSKEEISEYKDKLPEELLNVWRDYGLGTFLNGYIKVIDPKTYQGILEDSYFRGGFSIPIMVNGFGDVVTWEKNQYLGIVKYRKSQFDVISFGSEFFFDDLANDFYLNKYFNIQQYEEAYLKYGELKFNECFGYVPLLGLGGPEDVDHLQKVRIIEHIALITQLLGKIE